MRRIYLCIIHKLLITTLPTRIVNTYFDSNIVNHYNRNLGYTTAYKSEGNNNYRYIIDYTFRQSTSNRNRIADREDTHISTCISTSSDGAFRVDPDSYKSHEEFRNDQVGETGTCRSLCTITDTDESIEI